MAQENIKPRMVQPWASYGIAVALLICFLVELRAIRWGLAGFVFEDFAFRWHAFTAEPLSQLPTLATHLFLHADWNHVLSNTGFFLLFAWGVESVIGPWKLLVHFFLWGAAAALIYGYFWPFGGGMIGASGAISGAAGAFFVFHPLKMPPRKPFLKPIDWLLNIPSFFWIGLWFVGQLKASYISIAPEPYTLSRVAYGAHVGGFAFGALSTLPVLLRRRMANPPL